MNAASISLENVIALPQPHTIHSEEVLELFTAPNGVIWSHLRVMVMTRDGMKTYYAVSRIINDETGYAFYKDLGSSSLMFSDLADELDIEEVL